jgi:RNA polymerase sigma factor (TIGR02999 family)
MAEPDLSLLLERVSSGDAGAASEILPLVYQQLRQSAQRAMNDERSDHTLQATALVHEAYAKLVKGAGDDGAPGEVRWANRAHFYDAAGRAMRRILIDHARARGAEKRGGGAARLPLTDYAAAMAADPDEVAALDRVFTRLEHEEPDLAALVRLRFFAGLSGDEAAQALGVSARKADSMWALARAWLFRALEGER